MKLIVIIPAFNEEQTIGQVVKEIPKNIDHIDTVKIFVIDDGSIDQTQQKALEAGADRVIENNKNLGLSKTFKRGLEEALKDGAGVIVNIDADAQYNARQIPEMIQPILEQKVDIVIGDRQVRRLKFMKWGNKYGNLLGSWVLRRLTGCRVQDASSGFRAFSRESALRLNIHFNYTYTHETIIQAISKDLMIENVPIEFRPRISGDSKLINGLLNHIKKASAVILRTVLLYKPLRALFYLGLIPIIFGSIIGVRFIYYFVAEGGTGKVQSLILGSMLIVVGIVIITLGLIGDLIAHNRKINEEVLYQLKKQNYCCAQKNYKTHQP